MTVSLSSLSTLSGLISNQKTLADYVGSNSSKSSSLSSKYSTTPNSSNSLSLANTLAEDNGDTVTLSAAAQKLLAQAQTKNTSSTSATSSTAKTSQVTAKTGAKTFFAKFFSDSGIDMSKLSDEAKSLISGMQKTIADSGLTTQDSMTDALTAKASHGARKSFTLTGDGQRMAFTVTYAQGKPVKMTVTDAQNGTATTAEFTITSKNGKASTIDIARAQKSYNKFGSLTATSKQTPLSIKVY